MEKIYEFLSEYELTEANDAQHIIRRFSRADVEGFFEDYHSFISSIPLGPRPPVGAIDVFPDSWSNPLPINVIRQLGLYANTIYTHDPILDCHYNWRELDVTPKYVIQYPDKERRLMIFLQELYIAIAKILAIKVLVAADIVRFIPSQLLAAKSEPGALYVTSFYGPESSGRDLLGDEDPIKRLPAPIIEYAREHLRVYPAKVVDYRYEIQQTEALSPCRIIAIHFPGDPAPKIFNLFEVRPSQARNRFEMRLDTQGGGQPVDQKTFERWVQGSRDEALLERVRNLQRDLYLAEYSGARFLTNLPASKDLASLDLQFPLIDRSEPVLSALLRVRLPYFDGVSDSQLVKARRNEAAFEEFRSALDKAFRAVEGASGGELQTRVDEIVRDLLLAPIARIESRMKSLRRNLFLDSLMLVGTLGATVLTQGNTLTTAAALLVARRTLSDYKAQKSEQDRIKESPGFFYWEATKGPRKRR